MKGILPSLNPRETPEAYRRIVHWFFDYPAMDISLSSLARKTKTSKVQTTRIVTRLEQERFLRKTVLGRLWVIRADPGHPYFLTKKIPWNLERIYASGLLTLIKERFPSSKAVVLFGSYRKGDELPESDIDIAVEVTDNKPLEIVEVGIFPRLGYRRNVPVKAHVFSRKRVDLNLFANIANGIVLDGFLEVQP